MIMFPVWASQLQVCFGISITYCFKGGWARALALKADRMEQFDS